MQVYPTLLSVAGLAQPAAGLLAGGSLSPWLGLADASRLPPRKPYAVSQYHSNMGNTGAFCIVHGKHKYITFGHGFNQTYGAYGDQLFDLEADPNELHNLASTRPSTVAALDAMLRAELASGFNALSRTGDPYEIDVYVKRQQQQLYHKFFLSGTQLERRHAELRACEAARAALSTAAFIDADPELEGPCAASLDAPLPAAGESALPADAPPSEKLLKLFESAYRGFDEATDWPKVEAWAAADPGN